MNNTSLTNGIEIMNEIILRRQNKVIRYTLTKENDNRFTITITDEKDTLSAKDITNNEQKATSFFERLAYGGVDSLTFFEVVDDFLAED